MIEFKTETDRVLAKAKAFKSTNIKEDEIVILRKISGIYHHAESCYADSTTGRWLGRYKLKDFEAIRHIGPNEIIFDKDHKGQAQLDEEHEQLSLF